MAGPYPLATLAAEVTPTGISAPTYADVFASLQASYQSIFGSDAYVDPDSQDGQMLAIFAQAISDANSMAIAVYNAFSPATAKGIGLSTMVKINGLQRLIPSYSTCDVRIVGQTGTQIVNGIVADDFRHQWALPASVVIPGEGEIVVTATCTEPGAIEADVGEITTIVTPTAGWQSVNNTSSATAGAPLEDDATLRKRQSVSTALPALSVLDAIIGQIANLDAVEEWMGYENDTGVTDSNGVPRHSIEMVVLGGDATEIANVIALTKTPGTGTYGTVSEMVIDKEGIPNTIWFSRPTMVRVTATVSLTPLIGYVSTTGDDVKASLAAYVSALAIGEDVPWWRLFGAAYVGALSSTYDITAITIGRYGGSESAADLVIGYRELADLVVADVAIELPP